MNEIEKHDPDTVAAIASAIYASPDVFPHDTYRTELRPFRPHEFPNASEGDLTGLVDGQVNFSAMVRLVMSLIASPSQHP